MAPIWIEAALAVDIAANGGSKTAAQYTLCERAHAGLIRTTARAYIYGDIRKDNGTLPKEFWWAEGHEALDQNWGTGDFSTWIDKKVEFRAFGVRFALDDVLEILPVEQRALVAVRTSVAGNPDWVSAKEAHMIWGKQYTISGTNVDRQIIEQAKLGFVTARAVQMCSGKDIPARDAVEREWDVPTWFWRYFCESDSSARNWDTGAFSGRAYQNPFPRCVELTGVHFLRSTIEIQASPTADDPEGERKPRLPDGTLQKWWEGMADSREHLAHDQLLLLVRAKYPENHIARDRIRELAGDRKPGKKPIGG